VNIAAQPDYVTAPNVGGHLAGQAAVTIGAFTTVNDIYAGAAVTTGASSRVKHIDAGAAAGVGANAFALDVNAGAAVVVGANGQVGTITAGAAITLGAGVGHMVAEDYAGVVTRGAGSKMEYSGDYTTWKNAAGTATGKIKKADDMAVAMSNIDTMLARTGEVTPYNVNTNTDLSNSYIGTVGNDTTVHYSAINLQANTELEIRGNVTVITSEAMTMGAGAEIVLLEGAQVTWILGGSLNLGAGSKFSGETYINGAVNGATSDIECGNLHATGAVSINTIGEACEGPKTAVTDEDGVLVCPLWGDVSGWNSWSLITNSIGTFRQNGIHVEMIYTDEDGKGYVATKTDIWQTYQLAILDTFPANTTTNKTGVRHVKIRRRTEIQEIEWENGIRTVFNVIPIDSNNANTIKDACDKDFNTLFSL
jgi:hypothetical protein